MVVGFDPLSSSMGLSGVEADVRRWAGKAVPTPSVDGAPKVDVGYLAGEVVSGFDPRDVVPDASSRYILTMQSSTDDGATQATRQRDEAVFYQQARLDSRRLRSTPQSGGRAGFDRAKKKKGSEFHAALDALGNLVALRATRADELDRAQVAEPSRAVREAADATVENGFVDQGYSGEDTAKTAKSEGVGPEVVKHAEAKRRFVLLPRRWVVQRSFGWLGRRHDPESRRQGGSPRGNNTNLSASSGDNTGRVNRAKLQTSILEGNPGR